MKNVQKMTLVSLLLLGCMFICLSCKNTSSITETASREKIEVVWKDSVRWYDSVVVVPVERYVDVVRDYDTLVLETSQAIARCWVDSIFLEGMIENKKAVEYKYVERWNDRVRDSVRWRDKVVYRDKTTTREVKRPVNWWSAALNIVFILIACISICKKYHLK